MAWLWLREERRWLRELGLYALAIVILQGVIGGQRVTLNALAVPGFNMSLGEMLRIPHGILAQIYVCVLIAIAVQRHESREIAARAHEDHARMLMVEPVSVSTHCRPATLPWSNSRSLARQ